MWPFKPYTDFSGSNASVTGDRALLTNCGLSVELQAMALDGFECNSLAKRNHTDNNM